MRKAIGFAGEECRRLNVSAWRQYKHNIKQLKRLMRKAEKTKRPTYKDEGRQVSQVNKVLCAHKSYIEQAEIFLDKISATESDLQQQGLYDPIRWIGVDKLTCHARRQINQIRRRVFYGEIIPHEEKVFSIFEEHTEWISKGKKKAPVELGLRVCITTDQYGFVLHHRVMEGETDVDIAVAMVIQTQERFNYLDRCSFDKGFYSKENHEALNNIIDVTMPKKGYLNKTDLQREHGTNYIKRRHQHSAVESAINALEVHGLDRCLDHGIVGFKRYVALAVTARNIQHLGSILKDDKRRRSLMMKKAA